MRKMILIRCLIQLGLLPVIAATSGFQLNGNPTCDNDLSITNLKVTCGEAGQGYQNGYNNVNGYGYGYRYNNGYNNGGDYSNSNYQKSSGQYGNNNGQSESEASNYMSYYANANTNYYTSANAVDQEENAQASQTQGFTPSGSSVCFPGDTAYVQGTINVPQTGLYGYDMENKACIYGLGWGWLTCNTMDFSGSICTTFGLEAYGCPEGGGQYEILTSFKIPEKNDEAYGFLTSVSGWYTIVSSTIITGDGYKYTCQTRIDTVRPSKSSSSSSSSSQSSANQWYKWKAGSSESSSSVSTSSEETASESSNMWSQLKSSSSGTWAQVKSSFNRNSSSSASYMMVASAAGFLGLVAAFFVRKRRTQVARIDLSDECAVANFELTSHSGVPA